MRIMDLFTRENFHGAIFKLGREEMAYPLTVEDYQREIKRMESEIGINNGQAEECQLKELQVRKSINEVKMLQEKALFIIKYNERKSQSYREEMEKTKKCLAELKARERIPKEDPKITGLLKKIEEMKARKIKLETELNHRKRVEQSGETSSTTIDNKKIKDDCDNENIKLET